MEGHEKSVRRSNTILKGLSNKQNTRIAVAEYKACSQKRSGEASQPIPQDHLRARLNSSSSQTFSCEKEVLSVIKIQVGLVNPTAISKTRSKISGVLKNRIKLYSGQIFSCDKHMVFWSRPKIVFSFIGFIF